MMTLHFPNWLETWAVAFPAALCLYVMVCATLHVILREAKEPNETPSPTFSIAILVPARNEELVVAECLESLLASDYPRVEVHLISDGSTDATPAIGRSYAERGVRVHEFVENIGKSAALQRVLNGLETDLVMVVDADTRLERNAVSELVEVFAHSKVVGATSNIQIKNAHTLLAKFQPVEYASIIGLLKRANSVWGGLFTVSGAASCFRTSAVRAVGGFASPSITEDIELSWRLQHEGGKLVYVPQAIACVEVPSSWKALWQQRMRWSQGLTEVLRLHRMALGSRNRSLYIFAAESLLCMSWVLALAGGLAATACQFLLQNSSEPMTPGFWHVLSIALFLCQTVTAAALDSHYARMPWSRLFLAVFYPAYFMVLILPTSLIGWCKGLCSSHSQRWERSERVAQRLVRANP